MKDTVKYLATLHEKQLHFVVGRMAGKIQPKAAGCCGKQPLNSPTPNGEWECDEGSCSWVWIPAI